MYIKERLREGDTSLREKGKRQLETYECYLKSSQKHQVLL